MRTRLLAIALFALVAGCGGDTGENRVLDAGEPIQAPFRPRLEIAISRSVTGSPPRRDLVIVDADGRDPHEVAPSASPRGDGLAWSPDSRRLAFAATTGKREDGINERSDIFVVDVDGGESRRLTSTGRAFAPVWSPDGQTIVFAELGPGPVFPPTATLRAVDVESGKSRTLLERPKNGFDVPSSFSPDGLQLAFTRHTWREPGHDGRVENTAAIYVLDTQSLELRKLADRAAEPAFSPDGTHLAYVTDRDENGELSYGDRVSYANELYVMDADGGGARRLTSTRDLNEGAPAWSPDGRLIAYQRGEVTGNAEGSIVLTVRPDGRCARPIAADPGLGVWYRSPAWRPARLRRDVALDCRPKQARPAVVPPAGNLSIVEARRLREYDLYWVGRNFGELVLSSISRMEESTPGGRGEAVHLAYGSFEIQVYPACFRGRYLYEGQRGLGPVPGDTTVRGVPAAFFEGGARLEIYTGDSTVVIFGSGRAQVIRIANTLRGLNVSVGAGEPLPRPEPGALEGTLACDRE
jgi:hypothetical protein